ncbi:hypothetical protein HYW94_03155 [Candidatus Uhrbacteria bacterium]|nr:hypothetical protein [Candidatus Uhrbacteria bacterium]
MMRINILFQNLRAARMKAENDETGLTKGFSMQEQLDLFTEQHGENVVAALKKELEKPKKIQENVDNPSRKLEKIDIAKNPETGDLHMVSIWNTGEEIVDANFDVRDKNILATIQAAPPDIRDQLLASLKDIRQRMIYPETGNDIPLIYIVRKNPSHPGGYSVFLRYPLKDAEHEREVTHDIPQHILESLQKTGAGNADKEFQKWLRTQKAQALKTDTAPIFNDLLKNDVSISNFLSKIPEKSHDELKEEEDARKEAEKKAEEEAAKKAKADTEKKERRKAQAQARAEKKAEEEARKKAEEEEKEKEETVRKEAEKKAEEEAAQKAKADAEKKAAHEKSWQAAKDELKKAAEEQEKNKREAKAILDNTVLPPHLEELKKTLTQERGKDGLSSYDIQRLNSLYEKWAKGEKEKEETARKEAEKKAQEEAKAAQKKADGEERQRKRREKKIDDLVKNGTDSAIEKFLNTIRGIISHGETNANPAERENAKVKFSLLTLEDYTPKNIKRYKTETPDQWRQRKIKEELYKKNAENSKKKTEEEARKKAEEEEKEKEETAREEAEKKAQKRQHEKRRKKRRRKKRPKKQKLRRKRK